MERTEFLAELAKRPDVFDYAPAAAGVFVKCLLAPDDAQAVVHVPNEVIARETWPVLEAACKQGYDVDHITRVTGYFSKTSGWNIGKTAELKDRYRGGLR